MLQSRLKIGLLHICQDVLYQMPTAYYARGRSSNFTVRRKPDLKYNLDDPMTYKLTETLEDEELLDEKPTSDTHSQKKIVFKTIERKFFKPPQEVNLLTWDAKEQIRYLHQEFPEEWTTQKLAQSFPISEDGVQRLLRSKFQPRTVNEVIKHDRRVQKAWKALNNVRKGQLTSGPIVSWYEMLKENGQLQLLRNAAGSKSLPQSDWQQKMFESKSTKHRQPGVYESIITGYLKLKATKDTVVSALSMKEQQQLADNSLSNEVYLQVLMKNVDKVMEKLTTQDYDKGHIMKNARLSVTSGTQRNVSQKEMMSDKDKHESLWTVSKEQTDSDEQILFDLRGTRKLSSDHQKQAYDSEDYAEMSEDDIKRLQKENIAWLQSEKQQPPEDEPKTPAGSDYTKPYVCDPKTGYQHPFGHIKHLPPKRINVSKIKKPSTNKMMLIQDGKNVYDEDGEFLYRTP